MSDSDKPDRHFKCVACGHVTTRYAMPDVCRNCKDNVPGKSAVWLSSFVEAHFSTNAVWPRPWRKWHGNYQKIFSDIRVNNGPTVIGCWPNAGKMNATDGTGRSWPKHRIALIRRSINEPPE